VSLMITSVPSEGARGSLAKSSRLGFYKGLNQSLPYIDGNANGLPNRPDILRAVGADSCRPALHSGPDEACHCQRVAERAALLRLAGHDQASAPF